jgi:UDP-N-acetylglucosamine transferase subunit ALG13
VGALRRRRDLTIVGLTGTGPPFPRLVEALATLVRSTPGAEVWVQHGATPLVPPLAGEPLVPRSELLAKMREASAIVTHAGCGSISDALRVGHVPVVVARRAALGEHVNDHQLELVEALAAEGRVVAVDDIGDLRAAIARASALRGTCPPTEPGATLRGALSREVQRLAERGPTRRTTAVWRALSSGAALLGLEPHPFHDELAHATPPSTWARTPRRPT